MDNSKRASFYRIQNTLVDQWHAHFSPQHTLNIALSGGLDSVVLTHALANLRDYLHLEFNLHLKLHAVHVHHGLSRNADAWALFCQDFCAKLSLPCHVERVNIEKNHLGLEAAARKARYQVFAGSGADVVALAHHQNDQIETFFNAALRGGGLRALSAMPNIRSLPNHPTLSQQASNAQTGKPILWRPLLEFSRAELLHYAEHHGLQWTEDESNASDQFLRNRLRNNILSQLLQVVPNAQQQIVASIKALQQDLQLLQECIDHDWQSIHPRGLFDLTLWRQLSSARRLQQLHEFCRRHALGTPSRHAVAAFAWQLKTTNERPAEWSLPHGFALAFRGTLQALLHQAPFSWLGAQQVRLPAEVLFLPHVLGLSAENLATAHLRVVQKTDTVQLAVGRKNIMKLLQEQGVSAKLRRIWPLIVNDEDECLAVVNVAVSTRFAIKNGLMPVVESPYLPRLVQIKNPVKTQ